MPVRLTLAVLALAALAACSGQRRLSHDEYYREAAAAFADENYPVAITRYKELLDQHPFSEHAEEAELRIAQGYYRKGSYAEAIAALNDFQRMHPMSPHLPEVYYLLGRSYMDQMTTIDRDQSASENAHGWFRVVIDRYPESSFAEQAREEIATCREALAEHELYIAEFYLKRKNLKAVENRVKGILETYPDTAAANEAVERLAAGYERAGDGERAALARRVLSGRAAGSTSLDGGAAGALLADLSERYGSSPRQPETGAAPVLRDPVGPPPIATKGDPRYGPGPGNAGVY
jgi:outer membrane protein assembly factor BamD